MNRFTHVIFLKSYNNLFESTCSLFFLFVSINLYSLDLFREEFQTKSAASHARLIELLLTVICFVLPLYSPTSSIKRKFLKKNVHVLAFSRTLLIPLAYVPSHTCLTLFPSCLLLLVIL